MLLPCAEGEIRPLLTFLTFDNQGLPGEKGAPGSSDVIAFNEKLLNAFQVRLDTEYQEYSVLKNYAPRYCPGERVSLLFVT